MSSSEFILYSPLAGNITDDVLLKGISKAMQSSDSPSERRRIRDGIVQRLLSFRSNTSRYLSQVACVGPFERVGSEEVDRAGGAESRVKYSFLSDSTPNIARPELVTVAFHCLLQPLSNTQRKKKETVLERTEVLNVRLHSPNNAESESKEPLAELQVLGLSFIKSPKTGEYECRTEVFRDPSENTFSVCLAPDQFTILLVLCSSPSFPVLFERLQFFDKRGCNMALPYAAVCWTELSLPLEPYPLQIFKTFPRENSKRDGKRRRQEQANCHSAPYKRVRDSAGPVMAPSAAELQAPSDVFPRIPSSSSSQVPSEGSSPSSSSSIPHSGLDNPDLFPWMDYASLPNLDWSSDSSDNVMPL
jgi:hypothetical protein